MGRGRDGKGNGKEWEGMGRRRDGEENGKKEGEKEKT